MASALAKSSPRLFDPPAGDPSFLYDVLGFQEVALTQFFFYHTGHSFSISLAGSTYFHWVNECWRPQGSDFSSFLCLSTCIPSGSHLVSRLWRPATCWQLPNLYPCLWAPFQIHICKSSCLFSASIWHLKDNWSSTSLKLNSWYFPPTGSTYGSLWDFLNLMQMCLIGGLCYIHQIPMFRGVREMLFFILYPVQTERGSKRVKRAMPSVYHCQFTYLFFKK